MDKGNFIFAPGDSGRFFSARAKVEVTHGEELKEVTFIARWIEDAWRKRREVELRGMDEAMMYYREKGYLLQ